MGDLSIKIEYSIRELKVVKKQTAHTKKNIYLCFSKSIINNPLSMQNHHSLHSGKLILFIILFQLTFSSAFSQAWKEDPAAGIQKYITAMQIIKSTYVDSVDEPKLVENSIIEVLKELDPHSTYISKKDVDRANEGLVGNFEGIGVQFEILKDTITVVHPIVGGPSEKLGIMSGDKIIKINNEDATGSKISNQYVLDRLRGKKGTKVVVSIYRKGRKDLMEFTIIRDKIPINSIDAAYMIAPATGYINLNRFSQTSLQEFNDAVKRLKSEGMQNLVLDLRNNAGGYLNTAIELSDEFLTPGKLIVYTEGMRSPREDYSSSLKGLFEKGKLVIMINENSASASEIVSGAVQDWDRGIIVGRRSFGKGLVQRPFILPDSSQIRVTTARYHTPSGRCIQKPYSEGSDKYYEDFANRVRKGELENADSIKFPDSLKYHTANGRIVYGGGGIMPDVFIPWDTTPFTDLYLDLRRKNVVNLFVSEYVDKNRGELQKENPDFKTFDQNFQIDDLLMSDFLSMGEREGVNTTNEQQYALSEKLLKTQLKSLIAQKLWDVTAFYKVFNKDDAEVQKAVVVIQDDDFFRKNQIQP
jgi:carboxyl-terminal processing protease